MGNMLYLGGWTSGKADVTATSGLLQQMATPDATGGIGLLVAADQRGRRPTTGGDFTGIPSALTQGIWDPAHLRSSARDGAPNSRRPASTSTSRPSRTSCRPRSARPNGPIGRWDRQFGSDPAAVGRSVTAFTQGMADAGVQTSVKHFPGIRRIRATPTSPARVSTTP